MTWSPMVSDGHQVINDMVSDGHQVINDMVSDSHQVISTNKIKVIRTSYIIRPK